MKKLRIDDDNYKISNVWSNITFDKEWHYFTGTVFTPLGMIDVYSQDSFRGSNPSTTLRFTYKGRMYHRYINRAYTARGLAILAHRFAKEIVK